MTLPFETWMKNDRVAEPLTATDAVALAGVLNETLRCTVYTRSITFAHRACFVLARRGETKQLVVIAADAGVSDVFTGDKGEVVIQGAPYAYCIAPADAVNAGELRRQLPFLRARLLGLDPSIGCGDRLGLATPGHIRAVAASSMAIIAAQQSVRENSRTGRTPQRVMDDAMWGVFEQGWRSGFGADADHLKTPADADPWIEAGYTFYTVDPGDHVDDEADEATASLLREKATRLPWDVLESDVADTVKRLARPIRLDDETITMTEEQILRAAAKYGGAVAHTVVMYRHLLDRIGANTFELEVSVDETATATRIEEHIYIANELKRLGVQWVSLAPRFVGAFEKGVDYIGDTTAFRREFQRHVSVAQAFGPYKLSLHSGSDKFSLYPIVAEEAGNLVHLKTAGTSYLEALRTVAHVNPTLFREIIAFAIERYGTDRATYFVSGNPARIPPVTSLSDTDCVHLLDQFDARQVLHVTFGSVLQHKPFYEQVMATLKSHEDVHYDMVQQHFGRHLASFS